MSGEVETDRYLEVSTDGMAFRVRYAAKSNYLGEDQGRAKTFNLTRGHEIKGEFR